jgi:hypothetical protein
MNPIQSSGSRTRATQAMKGSGRPHNHAAKNG